MKAAGDTLSRTSIAWPSDLLRLHRLNPSRYPFLLESVADGTSLGRFDILFACPQDSLILDSSFALSGRHAGRQASFLDAFDDWWSGCRSAETDTDLPFRGGWFVMLGYELGREIEPTLELRADPDSPVAVATRIPVAIVRDRRDRQAWLVAESGREPEIGFVLADLAAVTDAADRDVGCGKRSTLVEGEFDEEDPQKFSAAIARAQRYIRAGDIFQANLARRWQGRLRNGLRPADIYARLRATNPAPFAGLAVHDDFAIISSSPERLLRIAEGRVETRPIAGTRPRLPDGADLAALRRELLDNPKERAEHVMVIDLERNDIGRICTAGSVEVDEFMVIESYSHVHHIVSNVTGRLVDNVTPGSVIAAVFPGGSITGCPKVRCMEIINELEGRPRGMYTGAMGYINRDGSADLSILIRCITTNGSAFSLSTGCGIVADSVAERELEETRAKAKGLLMALTQPDDPVPALSETG